MADVAGCQVIGNAVIPFGYEVWKDGVFSRDEGVPLPPDGADIGSFPPSDHRIFLSRLSLRPIWISGIGRVQDTEDTTAGAVAGVLGEPLVQLTYDTVDGRREQVWCERSKITDKDQLGALGGLGLPADSESARKLLYYLVRAEASNGSLTVPVARRAGPYTTPDGIGWVLGPRWIGPGQGVRSDPRPGRAAFRAFTTVGSWDTWRERWRFLASQSWVARVCMGAAFAAPMLRFLKARTFILHHWGTSGIGKTAMGKFATSVWGDPDITPLFSTMNRTDRSISAIFAHVTDLPVMYDEKQVSTIRSDQFIYEVCSGIPRDRAQKDGTIREDQSTWVTLARTTGEAPLVEQDDLGGQNNRVLQLHAAVGVEQVELESIYEFVRDHHGHAGWRFLQHLSSIVNNPASMARLRQGYDRFREQLAERTGRSGNHIAYTAVIALANAMAEHWLLGLALADTKERALEDAAQLLRENVHEVKLEFADKALARLRDHRFSDAMCYIDARNMTEDDLETALRTTKKLVGIEYPDAVVYIPSAVNAMLYQSRLSPDKVWREFSERGWINHEADHQTMRLTLSGKRVRVYNIIADVFRGPLTETWGGAQIGQGSSEPDVIDFAAARAAR